MNVRSPLAIALCSLGFSLPAAAQRVVSRDMSLTRAAAAAPVSCAWVTDDDFVFPGASVSSAVAVAESRGNVIAVAGSGGDGVSSHWLVRTRKVNGTTWATSDDFVETRGYLNHPEGIASDNNGTLHVVGGSNNLSNAGNWLVRRSTDKGSSWSTTDTFGLAPAGFARAVTSNPLAVTGCQAASDYTWYTRTSTDGVSWTPSDDAGPNKCGKGIASDSVGNLYAAAHSWDGRQYRWQVRKKTAASASWVLVDEVVASPNNDGDSYGAQPAAVFTDGATVYVTGTWLPAPLGGPARWLVRKSTNGGATWTTVEDLTQAGKSCGAKGGFATGNGVLYVAGRCHDGTSYHWLIRRSANSGATWSNDDDYQLASGATAGAAALQLTSRGELFSVGSARAADNTTHWVVRRRGCGP